MLFYCAFSFILSMRDEKNLFCREFMNMPCTNLEVLHERSCFCSLTKNIAISSNCCAQIYKSYMQSHFCLYQLTGSIVIICNCSVQIHKSYMHDHFHICHLIRNNVAVS